ncbi:MAG: dipicolinate synthase subunit DpsA [Clostridia bacterium]|nr:dipicolinate synthase subunit DpsA [Clostridia bacterium]MBQ2153345.1 dipicolinate synthase subunit DpsA [Clostridia bacterium]MBQ2346890.1 dipicolinate synthase subunit DpsA [Clostridia bacterium]
MFDINTVCIVGGDKRQIFMGLSMLKDGINVIFYGVDNCTLVDEDYSSLKQSVQNSDCVILPMPLSKDGKTLFTPLSDMVIPLDSSFCEIISSKPVFCTNSRLLKRTGNYENSTVLDYLDREELAVFNAVPTAEGALEIAMRNYQKTINSSSCLVAGYGRIGKVLSKMLYSLGANVTVSARKLNDLTWIRLNGYNPIHTSEIAKSGKYDIIFNTIPSMIFDEDVLSKIAAGSLVIDLASAPGGVDFDACAKLQIKVIHALSLPGKVAPVTAGEIIKNTIYNMIREE